MQAPIEIAFHNIEKADWEEDAIRDHVARLEQMFDRLTTCRVRVDQRVGVVAIVIVVDGTERLLARVDRIRPVAEAIGVGVVVGVITYASLIVGELVPKQIALRDPEAVAVKVAPATVNPYAQNSRAHGHLRGLRQSRPNESQMRCVVSIPR